MPEYRQLSFDLPGFGPVVDAPSIAKPNSRQAMAPAPSRSPVARRLRTMGEGKFLDVDLTAASRNWLEELELTKLATTVVVCWNHRLATTAGLAYHQEARVELNRQLLDFPPDEPERTLKHELAHLIAHHRAGRRRIRPHGIEWQTACDELGIPGEDRCHNLPFERRQMRKKYAYRCRYCQIVVPRVRPLARDSACYPCCRKHNRGRFNRRFLLDPIPLEEARLAFPEAAWA